MGNFWGIDYKEIEKRTAVREGLNRVTIFKTHIKSRLHNSPEIHDELLILLTTGNYSINSIEHFYRAECFI